MKEGTNGKNSTEVYRNDTGKVTLPLNHGLASRQLRERAEMVTVCGRKSILSLGQKVIAHACLKGVMR